MKCSCGNGDVISHRRRLRRTNGHVARLMATSNNNREPIHCMLCQIWVGMREVLTRLRHKSRPCNSRSFPKGHLFSPIDQRLASRRLLRRPVNIGARRNERSGSLHLFLMSALLRACTNPSTIKISPVIKPAYRHTTAKMAFTTTEAVVTYLFARPTLPALEPGAKVYDQSLIKAIEGLNAHSYIKAGRSPLSPTWLG